MLAYVHPLNSVLAERQQWVVPVYQRHYECETREGRQIPKLWEDLREKAIEMLDSRNPFPHYFGPRRHRVIDQYASRTGSASPTFMI